jgi:hypothetical protein
MSTGRGVALAVGVVALLAVACGSGGSSQFGDGNTLGDGTQNGGGGNGGGFGGASSGSPGGVTPGSACATSSAATNAPPIHLVFMFDRSGSMKFNPQPNNKWDACTTGLKSFFGDPSSANFFASMQVFPSDGGNTCNVSAYQNYLVPEVTLPDSAGKLGAALDANGPQPNFGTPTLPAMKGAIGYAQGVKAKLTNGEKVAVVLVTDGEPNDCNSNPQNVAAEAATVAATIPTYVIGIGTSLSNLDTIAQGGGTNKAIIVSDANPNQITPDFEAAVGAIKNAALGCEYALPKPPNGQQLDINAVNVNYTPGGGQPQTLTYSKDCSNPNGWHYDNPADPQHVEMCPGICDTLKKDQSGGKLDVIFGCQTAGGVTR